MVDVRHSRPAGPVVVPGLGTAERRRAILDDVPARWESLVVVDRDLITGQNPIEATVGALLKVLDLR